MLMGGMGERFQAVVRSVGARDVQVFVEKILKAPAPSPVEITLCQSLLRSDPMDYLIQKTSELGADRIFPFVSARTVAKIPEEKVEKRLVHWRNIAVSSAKQCGRPVPASLFPPMFLAELLAEFSREDCLKVVLWEEEESSGLKPLLKAFPKRNKIIGMIGPEGGFSANEIRMAKKEGFVPVSVGNRILRAETAGLTLVALVQYEWGDLGDVGSLEFNERTENIDN